MKNVSKTFLTILSVFITSITFAGTKNAYTLQFTVKELKEGDKCQLCYYYGNKQYIKDSAKADAKGVVTFKGTEKLDQGMYLFVLPGQKYFDFIVDEPQQFSLSTDTVNFIKHMQVKGSKENTLFFDYQKYMIAQRDAATPIRDEYAKVVNSKDSLELLKNKLIKLSEDVAAYQDKLIQENPNLFITKFIKATREVIIPEAPILANGRSDSTFAYHYFKAHYFDNFDLGDDRMLRTPLFQNFIDRYLEKLTVPMADSLNIACDTLIARAKPNREMFKYMVWWLTLHYETSKYMGMDAVFVHLVENYYMTGQADWVDSTQLANITKAAMDLKPLLLGKQAPSLNMKDSTGKYISLYDVKSKYTVVIFWDHDCGHCKKAIPKLDSLYKSTLKGMGVTVYAVETENQVEPWKKFVREHKLDFINVHETDDYYRVVAKQRYNIKSTPMIYLLDEKKVIKAKKMDPEQIETVIKMIEKEKEAELANIIRK
jgi:peroxiredoxin